jgi:hypothetical protein
MSTDEMTVDEMSCYPKGDNLIQTKAVLQDRTTQANHINSFFR